MAATSPIIGPIESSDPVPTVHRLTLNDLRDALRQGFDDFVAMPTHVLFLCLIYPLVGLVLGRALLGTQLVHLVYPLVAGFALLGPFAAIGLYELSRRREMGLDTSWRHAFDVLHSPSLAPILELGALLLVVFIVWIATADAIYVAHFGHREPAALMPFLAKVLMTPAGHGLLITGNIVGLAFAALCFSLAVISFPMLLDRNVGFAGAVMTSLRVVARNPLTMAAWALIVAVGLLLGALPFFVGLALAFPVLGHATWHLYRKAVEPDREPHPIYTPPVKYKRYGADFPASLFVASSHREDE